MARTAIGLSLAVALVSAFLFSRSSALSSTCTNTLLTLAPCLDYMKGKTSTPAPSCCSQLGGVVKSHAECLCVLVDGEAASLGFSFNQSQALALPGACNVETPPLSQCKGVSGAVGSPATPSVQAPAPSAPVKQSAGPASGDSTATIAPVAHAAHAASDHADADAGHADAGDAIKPNGKGTSTATESSGGSSYQPTTLLTMFSALFVTVCASSFAL